MEVSLSARAVQWTVSLWAVESRFRVALSASDGERTAVLTEEAQGLFFWPWTRWRWRMGVRAVVVAFPAGRPFSVRDLQGALPRALQETVNPGFLSKILGRLWEEGEVIKVRKRYWARPSHPDFSSGGWRAFLEEARRRGNYPGPGHQEILSTTYCVELWEKRIRAARTPEVLEAVGEEIRTREPNPEVRKRLRSAYRKRMGELKSPGRSVAMETGQGAAGFQGAGAETSGSVDKEG